MITNDELKLMTNMVAFLTMYMQGVFNFHDHVNLSIIETNSFIGRSSAQMILTSTLFHSFRVSGLQSWVLNLIAK
jgi:hypothetical protein